MKTRSLLPFALAVVGLLSSGPAVFGADKPKSARAVAPSDPTLPPTVQRAIDRGLAWLAKNQNTNGWWSTADHPAMTGLALAALMGDPTDRAKQQSAGVIEKGYGYLLASVRPDGSIHRGTLANYNTSISLVALALANNPAYEPVLRKGRAFVVRSQNDFGEPGRMDTVFDGGVGYGDKYTHSDLNNTLAALEAIRATEPLVRDRAAGDLPELNWAAAIHFIQSCQNLPGQNPQPWVSDNPQDRGGFVYYPGVSMAGGVTNATTGKVALRSYGSISYAGLLSYIYADLKPDDARVKAVLDWLRSNYTLDENPGMGQQGLFYYLHLMTKGRNAARFNRIELKDGRSVNWRQEVAQRLLQLQQADGSWANANNRWWEKDPVLVTSYAVMSLEMIARGWRG